jgi:hypothetical protein
MKKILILSWIVGAALVFTGMFLISRTSDLSAEEYKLVQLVRLNDPSAPADNQHWVFQPYKNKGSLVTYNQKKCWFVYGGKVRLLSEKN